MGELVAKEETSERAPPPQPMGDTRPPRRAFDWTASLPPEIAFLAHHDVAPGALLFAAFEAGKSGVSADQVLLNEGLMNEDDFYRLLAGHVRAPFYAGEIAIDAAIEPVEAVWSGAAALAPNDARLSHVVAPRGAAVKLLIRAAAAGVDPEGLAIASPRQFLTSVTEAAGAKIAEAGALALKAQDAALSADRRVTAGQAAAAILFLATGAVLALGDADLLKAIASIALWAVFGSSIALRLWASAQRPAPRERPCADRDLPVYSIVVALYREANMVDQLVAALDALDYPRAKLDVTIVLEQGDEQTLHALRRRGLAARYSVIVAPRGEPRTKPRALNIALPFMRGRYVVVYDAEDKPDRDQLRRAVARFEAEPDIGCLQARLAIEETGGQWLATMFAVEYAALFDALNPGLAELRAPIALGGTSNHFRTDVLRRVGGWDAWNVAEDADLGLRLARFGVRVATFDSDTYEEAPAKLGHWLAQRRRWHKGWLQTALVHSRDPGRLLRELGPFRAWGAASLMGGAVFGAMLGPFFTVYTLWRCAFGDLLAPRTWLQSMASAVSVAVLIAGLFSVLAPAIVGLRRRGLDRLIWAAPLLPAYYVLISLAAWLALVDLCYRPFHWSKTEHGARRTPPPSRARPGSRRPFAIDIARRLPTVPPPFGRRAAHSRNA
ncbi:MAG TPA: glycosyltransferase [Roseiarcus sp.]|nr:glycosyltransferase [Roseiarcus sp.]